MAGGGREIPSCSVLVPALSVFSSTATQLRKVPLKKPDGEIKPYSSMEREGKQSLGLCCYYALDQRVMYFLTVLHYNSISFKILQLTGVS